MIKDAKQNSWERFVAETTNENLYGLAYKLGSDKLRAKEILNTLGHNQVHTKSNIYTINCLLERLVPLDADEYETKMQKILRNITFHQQLQY